MLRRGLSGTPILYGGNVETSTMLMTRVTDLRTPSSRTEDFSEALKVRKVPTAMMEHNMAV